MPITSAIDPRAHLVRFDVRGAVTTDDMTKAIDAVTRELAGADGGSYDVLSDHRGLETPATPAQLESLVWHLRLHGRPMHGRRWAIVTRAAASYGMMRMLSVLAERIPMEVSVFQDLAEAEGWLAGK